MTKRYVVDGVTIYMHARTSLTERLLMFWSTRFDAAVTESLRWQEFVSSVYMRRWYRGKIALIYYGCKYSKVALSCRRWTQWRLNHVLRHLTHFHTFIPTLVLRYLVLDGRGVPQSHGGNMHFSHLYGDFFGTDCSTPQVSQWGKSHCLHRHVA